MRILLNIFYFFISKIFKKKIKKNLYDKDIIIIISIDCKITNHKYYNSK